MLATYDQQAPKWATNLSINSDLLKKARDLDINLSAALEQALADLVKAKQREAWQRENREAIAAYNTLVEDQGIFSNGLRSF